ncbi:helix-turn-helix domain-containing protein [Rhodoferax aquaticus]|nr:helix-turn-helix domain-containing protein [Rhodoferax aquaticus]
MNDSDHLDTNDSVSAIQFNESLSAGAMIKAAREAAGLHVAALAVSMKVPVKKLEALESDRLDQLPDAVFVRALASSVCRTLKIDPTPVLLKLPQTNAPRLTSDRSGINAPFNPPSDQKHYSAASPANKPVVWLVVALLLAAFAILFLPDLTVNEKVDVVGPPQATVQMPVEVSAKPDLVKPMDVPVVPLTSQVEPQLAAPQQQTLESLPKVTASAQAPSALTAPSSPVTAPLPGAQLAQSAIVFKAKGDSWIEVLDASKAVQLRRIVSAGETVAVSGTLPLSVVIGRVDAVEVEVRGSKFGLSEIARDNVARFEVK